MVYVLTIMFACGVGCGEPPEVQIPQTYPTNQACLDAGKVWISKASNPTKALKGYKCKRIK